MPIFPFDDEEERRRRLLTPGINPSAPVSLPRPPWTPGAVTAMGGDVIVPEKPAGLPGDMSGAPPLAMGPGRPSSLPNAPDYRPINAARPELDMTGAPSIIPKPQTRYGEMQEAKDVYLQKTPGRLKSGLLGAAQGALQGLATGQGLGAALGGALAGGGIGAVNPRGLREQQFNQQVRPKILERFQYEDADRAQQAAAQKAQREDQAARAGILNTQSQIDSRAAGDALAGRKQTFEEGKLIPAPPGTPMLDPRTRKPVFTASPRESQTERDAQIAAELEQEMGTVEGQSQGSLQGRIEALKGRLTPDERRLLERPTDADDPQAVARAQSKWAKVQEDELNSIRRDTAERRKSEIGRRRRGGGAPAAATPGPPQGGKKAAAQSGPRNLKDLTSLWK